MKTTLQSLAADAANRLSMANGTIAKFAAQLATGKDAAHTMGWGESAFRAAGDAKAWAEVEHFLSRCAAGEFRVEGPAATPRVANTKAQPDDVREMRVGDAVRILRREFESRVMRAARYPARSTSVCSNLVEQEVLRATAEALEVFDGWLFSIAQDNA